MSQDRLPKKPGERGEAVPLPNPDPGAVDRGHEGVKPPGDEQGSAKANPGPVEREPPKQ